MPVSKIKVGFYCTNPEVAETGKCPYGGTCIYTMYTELHPDFKIIVCDELEIRFEGVEYVEKED